MKLLKLGIIQNNVFVQKTQTGDGWWLEIFIIIQSINLLWTRWGFGHLYRVDAYLFMLTLSFNPITEERLHLFLGSSYVNGPVNCSIGHRVGGHGRAREHKNTRFVMTIFTANRTKRQVLQNGRTIHQTQFWCHSKVKKYANLVEVNIITHKISWWIVDLL